MEKESLINVFNEMKSIIPDSSGKENEFKIDEFESFLTKMQKKAIDEAQKIKNSMKNDHPMFGPINLLRPMGRRHNELSYTKLLAYFLDPEESHGFGDKITHALLNKIFGSEFEYAQIFVDSEYYCNNDSRIDLWMTGKYGHESSNKQKFLVIIEAKVGASFGGNQLARYSKCASKWKRDNKSEIVHKILLMPDNKSSWNAKENDWQVVLFSDLFNIIWKVINDDTDKPGFHYARFYLTSIYQDVLGLDLSPEPECDPYPYLRFPLDSEQED